MTGCYVNTFLSPLSLERETECLKKVAQNDKEAKDELIFVSNRAQERMIRKMAERRPGMAKMVKVPGAKHELFGTRGRMLQTYWNMVFAFLEKDL